MKIGRLSDKYIPQDVENWVKNFWITNRIYEKIKEMDSKRGCEFRFVDGPPYANSDIPHIGHAWNKTLKDIVLRYKRMCGYRVFDKPGYDCHGLPIEVKVEEKLGIKFKKQIEEIGVERFIEECKKLVLRNASSMTKWFMELGVFMDWNNPYLTITNEYIEKGWFLIKKVDEEGLLKEEYKVVYWCPRCSTTLAEYEIEYREIEDPSIYVKLPVRGRSNWYLLIWTTTPWTLPANTFVMIKPSADYVAVDINGEILVLAKERLRKVLEEAGIGNYKVIHEIKGWDLVGLEYDHPLENIVPLQKKLREYHRVVASEEYVTLIEGTGLVHGAPGHGFEDFDVARKIGIEVIASPIDDEGRFTGEAGVYNGMKVREANDIIINDLKSRGALLYHGRIIHKYPVCWRCKTPVVMRATPQWVIKITYLKDKLLDEINKVNWLPKWGYDRIKYMIDNLQDWVISRQRYWGIPLPIWICPNGHKLVISSRDELVKYGGYIPVELHRPWIDRVKLTCPSCGLEMTRVSDVIDVWFDSGISFFALGQKGVDDSDYVLDFIVEGQDQFRGWFFSLLRAGVLYYGKAPYINVLAHGMVLDEKGREMHKSLGNYVGLDDVLKKFGRDTLRLAVVENTTWEDLRFSWRTLEEVERDLNIIWNTYVFASTYMSIDGFDPVENGIQKYLNDLRPEDRWIISRVNSLAKSVTEKLDKFYIHEAARMLHKFIIDDVSRWYIRLIRRRVWVEENTRDKFAAYATLYYVLYKWLIMASPFIPFITEKIYQIVFRQADPGLPESIHMHNWVRVDDELIDKNVEEEFEILRSLYEASASARMKAGVKLRQPIREVVIYTMRNDIRDIVFKYSDLISELTNAKRVVVKPLSELERIVKYSVKPEYRSLGPMYRDIAHELFKYIEENGDRIAREILEKGICVLEIKGVRVELTRNDVVITPIYVEGYSVVDTDWGSVAIDSRLTLDEISEGLARDIVRRIQVMRKELGLELTAKIKSYVFSSLENLQLIRKHVDYIMRETGSVELVLVESEDEFNKIEGYKKDWEINGEIYRIALVI